VGDPVVARLQAAVTVVDGSMLGCIGEDTIPGLLQLLGGPWIDHSIACAT
jgi:hypothetical protein